MTVRDAVSLPVLLARGIIGGILMGLANLVPGISGGTMLLASGVYPRFITAVAEVTTLRFRLRSLLLLGAIAVAALVAIGALAGPVRQLVAGHRWIMYSLFIGLTLGGVPLVWRMARPPTGAVWAGAVAGFLGMAAMAFLQPGAGGQGSWVVLLVAGMAGASAMVLPGVSGAYLLLVLGQYEVILGAVDRCKRALSEGWSVAGDAVGVIVPVAIGVLIGIVAVSNLVRWTLERYEKATLGVLLGLLFGSVLGIWPFQRAAAEHGARVYFTPTLRQVVAAAGLVVAGYVVTLLIGRIGRGAPAAGGRAG